jgi:hypothetical protein
MISLEDNMTMGDIEQWVGGGFFLTPAADGYVPAEVAWWPEHNEDGECFDDEDLFCLRLCDGDSTQVRFRQAEAQERIFPHWPFCGSINLLHHKLAVHVERLQMKQWRRTFNWRQVKILVPQQWALTGGSMMNTDEQVVRAIFNPEYPTDSLSTWFADGWKSVALTPHVIVTNTAPALMVYYNGELAAKLRTDGAFDAIDVRMTHLLSKLYPEGITL